MMEASNGKKQDFVSSISIFSVPHLFPTVQLFHFVETLQNMQWQDIGEALRDGFNLRSGARREDLWQLFVLIVLNFAVYDHERNIFV